MTNTNNNQNKKSSEDDVIKELEEFAMPSLQELITLTLIKMETLKIGDCFNQLNTPITHPTKEEAIVEAVKRMEILCFKQDEIAAFKKTGKISKIMKNGKYMPIDETIQKHINILEEKGILCYAAIHNEDPAGFKTTSYIITSDCKEKWSFEDENIKLGILRAYVYNHDLLFLSEYIFIPVRRLPNGTLIRIDY